jgi:pimeloyl-ACP methyl ester carboxylesterase
MDEFQQFLKAHEIFRVDAKNRRVALTESNIPIFILSGDNDTSVPVENWYPLVGNIPKGQLIVLPQSGHGPQHQYPELSAQYILNFLEYAN